MNITLIGMPGSGKSTISKKLAEELKFNLLELDIEYEHEHGDMPLQQILETLGEKVTVDEQAESAIRHATNIKDTVVSPGGSLIYTPHAMEHLKSISKIIYLKASLPTIEKRITGTARGLVKGNHKTLAEVYAARLPLYERWATVSVDAEQSPEKVVEAILKGL
jgi:shikimate kinase